MAKDEWKFGLVEEMNLERFEKYLSDSRGASEVTIQAYVRDVKYFEVYLKNKDIDGAEQAKSSDIAAYLMDLKESGKSNSTINRKLAAIRAIYKFFISEKIVDTNPTTDLKASKIQRRHIEYLTVEEVEKILEMPDETLKGKRDKAILEVMYATGVRVNEIVAADVEDVNLRIGFFTCKGAIGKARIVPLGMMARRALEDYLDDARDMLVKNNTGEKALFVNFTGGRMTRQGLWKILKNYSEKANLGDRFTPHILRNSFAVHMVQNGADLRSLQELLGHEDVTATQIYMYFTKNIIKDVYDKTHPRA